MSAYYVPTLCKAFYLEYHISSSDQIYEVYYYFPYLINEETKMQRLNDSHMIVQLVNV